MSGANGPKLLKLTWFRPVRRPGAGAASVPILAAVPIPGTSSPANKTHKSDMACYHLLILREFQEGTEIYQTRMLFNIELTRMSGRVMMGESGEKDTQNIRIAHTLNQRSKSAPWCPSPAA